MDGQSWLPRSESLKNYDHGSLQMFLTWGGGHLGKHLKFELMRSRPVASQFWGVLFPRLDQHC